MLTKRGCAQPQVKKDCRTNYLVCWPHSRSTVHASVAAIAHLRWLLGNIGDGKSAEGRALSVESHHLFAGGNFPQHSFQVTHILVSNHRICVNKPSRHVGPTSWVGCSPSFRLSLVLYLE